jgi:hypothetical protein
MSSRARDRVALQIMALMVVDMVSIFQSSVGVVATL